jgi:hypothetical protein
MSARPIDIKYRKRKVFKAKRKGRGDRKIINEVAKQLE